MDSSATVERNYLLDNFKGLLIFLVVFGHALEMIKDTHIVFQSIYIFIYVFHMPAFIFISGFFSKDVDKCRNTAFKNFLLPYLIFNTIWNVLAAIFVDPALFSFTVPGWALWYLLSMFIWRIFLKDLVRIKGIIPLSILIGIFAGLLPEFDAPLSMSRTLVFLPFFLLGYFTTEQKLQSIHKLPKILAITFLVILAGISTGIAYTNIVPLEFLYGSNSFAKFNVSASLGLFARSFMYLMSFLTIMCIIPITQDKMNLFSKIGSNTLPVYILHTYILIVVFGITSLVDSIILILLICVLSSLLITYSLSRNTVNKWFHRLLNKVSNIILRA